MSSENRNTASREEIIKAACRRAAAYCAQEDRASSQVASKLLLWNISAEYHADIISILKENGFIDDDRYCSSFIRGKFHQKQWGRYKIRHELKQKNISQEMIEKNMGIISEEEYRETLKMLIEKKIPTLKGTSLEKRRKLIFFLSAKGYEPEIISQLIENRQL